MRHFTGDGVEKDEVKGMDLLRKAAAGGDSAAKKELAKREPAKKE
jgi:TPR repeat protein